MWLILQREWPWLHTWWQWCRDCQRRHIRLSSGLPKDVLCWAHLTSSWKRKGHNHPGRQGRAWHCNLIFVTEKAVNILFRAQRHWRKQEIKLCSCWKGTDFKDDRERPRQWPPALAALGSMLWKESCGFLSPLPVKYLYRTLGAVFPLMCKDLAPHHYKWSVFFHKKRPLFLWNSPPQLCHRLRNKKPGEPQSLIRENQDPKSGITCQTSCQSQNAAFVHQG